MKNRLSKMSRKASFMLLLLAVSGISTSCKDEYILDDEKPDWLSTNILQGLEGDGQFQYYVRLLKDPDVNPPKDSVTGDYKSRPLWDVLQQTGSKTLFVAKDEAWEKFFQDNAKRAVTDPWHNATSFENLSVNQKKLLIHTSMLNNAIVMENLSASSSDIASRGDFMRRYTDVSVTDSITYLDENSLPTNYNVGNAEVDYWSRFREGGIHKGIHLVCDSSASMMVHFTNEHLNKNNVTDEDFALFLGRPRNTSDVHIYDALLTQKDGVAENGYVNITDKVIAPLPNMAELIRTNGQTNIFSHMLDRWSVPIFNNNITERYKDEMLAKGIVWEDSIFTKRYFSELSYGHKALTKAPGYDVFRDSKSTDVLLKFDPGWNTFYFSDERSGTTAPQYDMGAMFVPCDSILWKEFKENGSLWNLVKTYYLKEGIPGEDISANYQEPKTLEELYQQIDQIPISTLRSLINVIMFPSFVGSVPSKMTKLRDDAQEQIFFPEDVSHIKSTLLANNGLIYITDKVYGPADYTSVAAPAYISNTNLVMRWAIYNGSTKGVTDYMGLNYYAYLKAMQSRFVLFVPSDEAMRYYYDPVSFTSRKSRLLHLYYKSAAFPISYNMYAYNSNTGDIAQSYGQEKMTNGEITNRLRDILESHTLVLNGKDSIENDIDEYYLTKNGSAIKVSRTGGQITKVQGGFQLENEAAGIEGNITAENKGSYTEVRGIQYNNVTDKNTMNNGNTYILDSPIIPACHSVYNVFRGDDEYSKFLELCMVDEDVVRKCGLVDETNLTKKEQETELKKYQVFINDNGPDFNVQFFNNFNYTIFAPTNDYIDDAISKGLPTWEEMHVDYVKLTKNVAELDSLKKEISDAIKNSQEPNAADTLRCIELDSITHSDSLTLQTKATYLINFVRNHFIDNSVFVDHSTFDESEYVTASYDNAKGLFCKVHIRRPSDGVLEVRDATSKTSPWNTASGLVNIMARDVTCNKSPTNESSMNGITIDGSSFAVIHQIPGVLNHTQLVGGRHDSKWATQSEARKYLKRFAIKNR